MALLTAIAVFVLILLFVLVVAMATRRSDPSEIVSRRLSETTAVKKAESLEIRDGLIRDTQLSGIPILHRLLLRWSGVENFNRFLAQAGVRTKPGKLFLLCAVLGFGSYFVDFTFSGKPLFALPVGVGMAFLPLIWVFMKRRKRLRNFERFFPDAIDLLGRAVRAGHAFTSGMEMIAKELPEPVSGEFRTTFEEHNFGIPLREALTHLADRVPLVDVRFFIAGLLVQKETGGNLAELLDNLSRVIRERFKIQGEVRVRTAQGRLTAAMLISLPPGLLVVLSYMNPAYIQVLFTDPWGTYLLVGGGSLQLLGALIIWKIVSIEV
jgi:tight adherence protein B